MATTTEAPVAVTTAPDQLDKQAPSGARRRVPIRRILLIAVPLLLLLGAAFAYSTWRDAQQFVTTDNAQIAGQPVAIGSMNAGRVTDINVKVGDAVRRDVVIARVELPSQVGMAQNGQPKLDFLGAADTRVEVAAPFDGVVMSVPTAVGASVAAGQTIASIVDPSQLWVNANIDETSIDRIHVGQSVEVHVDALNADVPGRVDAIT